MYILSIYFYVVSVGVVGVAPVEMVHCVLVRIQCSYQWLGCLQRAIESDKSCELKNMESRNAKDERK